MKLSILFFSVQLCALEVSALVLSMLTASNLGPNVKVPSAASESFPPIVCKFRPAGNDCTPKQLFYAPIRGRAELCRILFEVISSQFQLLSASLWDDWNDQVTNTPYDCIMYFGLGSEQPWRKFSPTGQFPLYKGPEFGNMVWAKKSLLTN